MACLTSGQVIIPNSTEAFDCAIAAAARPRKHRVDRNERILIFSFAPLRRIPFRAGWKQGELSSPAREAGNREIRLQKPDRAIGIVVAEFFIFNGAQIAGPDDARVVDIGGVVDPFVLKDVLRRIVNEDQELAGNLREVTVDLNAAVGVAMVQSVPGFVLAYS